MHMCIRTHNPELTECLFLPEISFQNLILNFESHSNVISKPDELSVVQCNLGSYSLP